MTERTGKTYQKFCLECRHVFYTNKPNKIVCSPECLKVRRGRISRERYQKIKDYSPQEKAKPVLDPLYLANRKKARTLNGWKCRKCGKALRGNNRFFCKKCKKEIDRIADCNVVSGNWIYDGMGSGDSFGVGI